MEKSVMQTQNQKITHDDRGGMYILCNDGEYAGMHPASLSDILECSIDKAQFAMEVLENIVLSLDLDNMEQITDIVFSLANIIPEGLLENEKDIDQYTQLFQDSITPQESLVTLDDIAQILEITHEFATELYTKFNQPIHDEKSLEAFLKFIDNYLINNYHDTIPEKHKTLHTNDNENTKLETNISKTHETAKSHMQPEQHRDIFEPVAQEFRAESLIQPDMPASAPQETFQAADDPIITNEEPLDEYYSDNIHLSPYFTNACETLQDILEIDAEDAALLLTTPETLAEFLEIDLDIVTHDILTETANGNLDPLLQALNDKINLLVEEEDEDDAIQEPSAIEANLEINQSIEQVKTQNTHIPESIQQEPRKIVDVPENEQNDTSLPIANNLPSPSIQPVEQPDFKALSQQHLAHNTPPPQEEENAPAALPDNLSDTLRMAFGVNNRITTKTLVKTFEIFETTISQELARFIIEEGNYGAEEPNAHRILSIEKCEALIQDIEQQGSLRAFVKIYLEKVNNQLKSMMGSGG